MYKKLVSDLTAARVSGNAFAKSNLIGIIDAVDKNVFKDKKSAEAKGLVYEVSDDVVFGVIKNQIKNIRASIAKCPADGSASGPLRLMEDDVVFMENFLPGKVEGDDLRALIHNLDATNLGEAMKFLKSASKEQCFDYDGREASTIAKDIFL